MPIVVELSTMLPCILEMDRLSMQLVERVELKYLLGTIEVQQEFGMSLIKNRG